LLGVDLDFEDYLTLGEALGGDFHNSIIAGR
jgi:hypothetical protein